MMSLKKKFKLNNKTLGLWISIYSIEIAEIFAKSEFDWIGIDLEHSSINITQAVDLIKVIDLSGGTPLVRVTSNNEDQIKRCLDAGAHGIIVPMINNKDDAEKAVNSCYFPPRGNRGYGLFRANGYGSKSFQYFNWQKKNMILIVQIESKKAVDNIDDIFSVKGIDGYIIGPYDLSASLGKPGVFDSKEFKLCEKTALRVAKKNKLIPGIHIVEPNHKLVNKFFSNGYKMIVYSVDFKIIMNDISQALKKIIR